MTQYTFEVQVGKDKGKYKNKYTFTSYDPEDWKVKWWYNCINTHSGHKKRLLRDGKVIARVIT